MLAETDLFEIPDVIKTDMQEFVDTIKNELPDKQMFKTMGLGNVDVENIYKQIIKSFGLND